MEKSKWALLLSGVVLTVFIATGCGNTASGFYKDTNESITDELEEGMEISFAKTIGMAVINGAAGEVGKESVGLIISILTGGDSGEQDILDDMNAKFDALSTQLTKITDQLNSINEDINISKEEIIEDANNPSRAIDTIDNAETDFDADTSGVTAGKLDKDTACQLSEDLIYHYGVQDQIANIQDAMLPLVSSGGDGKNSVLTNYKDLLISKKTDIYEGYVHLERYVSKLLYYQAKALTLAAEAFNAPHTVGTKQCSATETHKSKFYAQHFETQKQQAVWDTNVTNSFISNVWAYAMHYLSAHDIETKTVDPKIQKLLQRAEFYRRVLVNDENRTGVNLMVIATADMAPARVIATYTDSAGKTQYLESVKDQNYTARFKIKGQAYPYWTGHFEKMKKSDEYFVYLYYYNAYENGLYGFYDLGLSKTEDTPYIDPDDYGTVTVSKYNTNYAKEDNGSIAFGLGVSTHSANGAYTYFNPKKRKNEEEHSVVTDHYGNSTDDIYRELTVADHHHADEYSGTVEYYKDFTYDGKDGDKLYMYYKVHVYREIEISPNAEYNAQASAAIRIGIYDRTADKIHHCMNEKLERDSGSYDKEKSDKSYKTPKAGCSYELTNGHEYSFFIQGAIDGDGNGGAGYANSIVKIYYPEEMRFSFTTP